MSSGRSYERKGDAFSLAVEEGRGPRTVQRWLNPLTGRDYFSRVPVSACFSLDVTSLREDIRSFGKGPEGLSGIQVIWTPNNRRAAVVVTEAPAPADIADLAGAVTVGLEATWCGVKRSAQRTWFTCPACGRRCRCLYGSSRDSQGKLQFPAEVGCRACLGLTDDARQMHRTTRWAAAVLLQREFPADATGWYRPRSVETLTRATRTQLACIGGFSPGK